MRGLLQNEGYGIKEKIVSIHNLLFFALFLKFIGSEDTTPNLSADSPGHGVDCTGVQAQPQQPQPHAPLSLATDGQQQRSDTARRSRADESRRVICRLKADATTSCSVFGGGCPASAS